MGPVSMASWNQNRGNTENGSPPFGGDPGESLIGTRECGSYAAHAWAVAALSSLACLARRRFGFSGPTARPFLPTI